MTKRLNTLWMVLVLITLGFSTALALDVKPTGRIYANFNYNLSGYPNWDSRAGENDFTEFALSRAYLGIAAKFSPEWSAVVVGDIYRPTFSETTPVYDEDSGELVDVEVEEKDGPYTYYVKYAYGQYKPYSALGFRLGIMPTPFIDRYEKTWGYRYVEKTPSDRVKWDSSADAGFAVVGDFPKNIGSYYVMVRNGEGYKKPEEDSGKAGHARILLTPFQQSKFTEQLQLTASYRYEREQRQEPETTSQMMNALLSYKYMFTNNWGFNIGAGYDWLQTETDIEEDDVITGRIVHGYGVVYLPYKLALFARIDAFDPDVENDEDTHGYQDETTYALAGISIDPVKGVAFAADVKRTYYTAEVEDDQGEMVTKTPETIFFLHSKFKF